MQNKFGYIYKTTNTFNSKVYIGKKEGNFSSSYLGSGLHLKRSIKKHGKYFFKLEVIVYANNKVELEKLEKVYIAGYRSMIGKKNVYNIADGGTGGNVWTNGSPSKEQRIKIGLASVGNKNHKSDCLCCVCKAQKYGRKGILNPMFGKHFICSEKTKEKIRLSKLGNLNPAKRPEVREKIRKAMLGSKRGKYNKK